MSELQNVIALTKLHISQHYKEDAWVFTDPETLEDYKAFAQKNRGGQPQRAKPPIKPTAAIKKTTRPKPAPVKPASKKTTASEKPIVQPAKIERELPKQAAEVEFSDFRKILEANFPTQKIIDQLPDDTKAKEVARRWEKAKIPPEIVILDSGLNPSEKLFLDNVARALEARFYPAAVLAPDQLDKTLKLRLLVGTADKLTGIEQPTVVMQPVDHYLQQPQEKAKLWQELKSTLQSS